MATQMRKGSRNHFKAQERPYVIMCLFELSHIFYFLPVSVLPKVTDFLIHTLCVGLMNFISKPKKTFTVDLLTPLH